MNLKKVAGTGTADYCSIGIHAWRDRKRIREEIEIIDPDVIIACGENTGRLLHHVLTGDLYSDDQNQPFWAHGNATVTVGNHPSVRLANAGKAFKRLINRAEQADVLPVD